MKNKITLILFTLLAALVPTFTALAASGWELRDGSWYVTAEGAPDAGWYTDGSGTYYLGRDGAMVTGWQTIAGRRYYFRQDGVMHTGWWQEGDAWYYFQLDGTLLMDATAPDGHKIKADGTWDAAAMDALAARISDQPYAPYIVSWSTDTLDVLADNDMVDMKVVSALLGRSDIAGLNVREKEVYSLVQYFMEHTLTPEDSDYEKVVKITRYIWRRGGKNSTSGDSPYHLLAAGGGTSTAYARTFKLMANAAGLECYYVYSEKAVASSLSPERGSGLEDLLGALSGYYPWNIVKVEGEWYNAAISEPGNGASAPYVLRCDGEFPWHLYKEGESPSCTATAFTKSKIHPS